jgi:diguanylate cyclase (GGDEF)-like protein
MSKASLPSDNTWRRRRDINLERLLERIDIPAFALARDGSVSVWNRGCERLTGLPKGQVVGTREHWRGFYAVQRPCLADLVHAGRSSDANTLYASTRASALDKNGLSAENWCDMPLLGARRYLAIDAFAVMASDGRCVAIVETLRDMTELKLSQSALASKGIQLDAALNNMAHGLAMFDHDDRLVLANARFFEIYGLDAQDISIGTPVTDIVAKLQPPGTQVSNAVARFAKFFAGAKAKLHDVILFERHGGQTIALSWRQMPDGGWVSTHEDVTSKRRAEREIEFLASHDTLTELANRRTFTLALSRELARTRRGSRFAVLAVDLDKFKNVNDTFGHAAGDELLKYVSQRLRGMVRASDIVSRIGGDEFAILQTDVTSPEDARSLAERIVSQLSAPFELASGPVSIGASVGVAVGPDDGVTGEAIMQAADMGLYQAKDAGRGCYKMFERQFAKSVESRRRLEVDLRLALERGELVVYYQPILDFETRRVTTCEALLRWTHPTLGPISPVEFVRVAEEIGLIDDLGRYVLTRACHDALEWPGAVRVAVNLSPAQFSNSRLTFDVAAALAASGLPAYRLQLEITENVMVQDFATALRTLESLKTLGVSVSLDDFGTGYSSLNYLRQFPFDKIKIDRSFIQELPLGTQASAIVKAVIGIGASLGMATTAEGVETVAQLDCLREEGCTEVQGWLFSAARPAHEIAMFIHEAERIWSAKVREPSVLFAT